MNQDIKELLELAAKACGGLVYVDSVGNWIHVAENGTRGAWWNPAFDDGDGARMEEQLGINITWVHPSAIRRDSVEAGCHYEGRFYFRAEGYVGHNGDRQAARRMASLRVAAEIGSQMNSTVDISPKRLPSAKELEQRARLAERLKGRAKPEFSEPLWAEHLREDSEP